MEKLQSLTRVGAIARAGAVARIGAVALVAASLLVDSGVAFADAKYTRKTMEIKVKQTEATKKIEAKKETKKDAPAYTADQFFFVQESVQPLRDAALRELIELADETEDDDPEKPDLLFRVAEGYSQKYRLAHNRHMEALLKRDMAKKPADKKKAASTAQKWAKRERTELINAIKYYALLAAKPQYKAYKRMDEALFYYAYTLGQAKRDDDARKVFFRLIKDYPQSRFIPEAYLSFAEYYFKNGDLATAEKFYDKVLQFPKAPVYTYAVYMKGWVYFNQGRPQESLETWFKVAQTTQGVKGKETLNRAAKKDFVRAYAEIGKPELAYKAFQRVDSNYAFKMLSFLGEFYLSQGKADKTIFVFREMLDIDAKDGKFEKEACDWQYTIVRAMLTYGNQEDKVKEIARLVKFWKHLETGKLIPKANLEECKENTRATTGELAKLWHQEGIKTKNLQTLAYVTSFYKLYQEYFPDADDAGEMQFYYAELQWTRAEGEKDPSKAAVIWEEAAGEYTRAIEMKGLDKKTREEAAYATVLAWRNALAAGPKEPEMPVKDEKDDGKPKPLPEKEAKMLKAFDYYLKVVKDVKNDERVGIEFLKARAYWRYNHFDKAIPAFQKIVRERPDHETAEFAANLLLDSYNRANRHEDLLAEAERCVDSAALTKDRPELKKRCEDIKAQGRRKLAEKYEKDGKYKECGNLYLEIFNKYPQMEDLDQVLFNAGVCFERAKLLGQAILMREQLTKRFPDKPLAQKAQFALGVNYSAIAYYDQAAQRYEEYAKKFAGEKDAPTALSNATFFRKGLGQDDKAIEDTNYFIKAYGAKKPNEAAGAHYSIADIYEKRKEYDNVIKHLQNYLKQWGTKGGVDRQIAAHVRMGQILWRQSCPVKGVNDACVEIRRERALKETGKKGKKKRSTQQTQCGPASKNKIVVVDRKAALVKAAQGHFNQALKLWANGNAVKAVGPKNDDETKIRTAQMIYWVAAANFYLAEEKYEHFLRVKFPENLDFSSTPKKAEESKKRFVTYIQDKQKALQSARQIYLRVVNDIKGGGAHWAIASAARVGQLFQNLSDALFTAEIPKIPDIIKKAGPDMEQEFIDAYCDALTTEADPLEAKSIEAFSFCLDTSTGLNWFNEWSRLCEGELAQIRPADFPTAGEIRAEPTGVPMTLDVQPIQTEIELVAPKAAEAPAGSKPQASK